jgi:hypothetical protein
LYFTLSLTAGSQFFWFFKYEYSKKFEPTFRHVCGDQGTSSSGKEEVNKFCWTVSLIYFFIFFDLQHIPLYAQWIMRIIWNKIVFIKVNGLSSENLDGSKVVSVDI